MQEKNIVNLIRVELEIWKLENKILETIEILNRLSDDMLNIVLSEIGIEDDDYVTMDDACNDLFSIEKMKWKEEDLQKFVDKYAKREKT